MSENNAGEKILEAVDILVTERLNKIIYDQTELCTILEVQENGYLVSNGSLKYTAQALNEDKYKVNDRVYISIPQGNYDTEKFIMGKYNSKEEKKESVQVNPLDTTVVDKIIDLSSEEIFTPSFNLLSDVKITRDCTMGNFKEGEEQNINPNSPYGVNYIYSEGIFGLNGIAYNNTLAENPLSSLEANDNDKNRPCFVIEQNDVFNKFITNKTYKIEIEYYSGCNYTTYPIDLAFWCYGEKNENSPQYNVSELTWPEQGFDNNYLIIKFKDGIDYTGCRFRPVIKRKEEQSNNIIHYWPNNRIFKYKREKLYDHIVIEFLINSACPSNNNLKYGFNFHLGTTDNQNYIYKFTSNELYGDPYNMLPYIKNYCLLEFPKDSLIDITKINTIDLNIFVNEYLSEDCNIEISGIKIYFGYDVSKHTQDRCYISLDSEQKITYSNLENPKENRKLYLTWEHVNTEGKTIIYNEEQLPDFFTYNIYWVQYGVLIGNKRPNLPEYIPEQDIWNWQGTGYADNNCFAMQTGAYIDYNLMQTEWKAIVELQEINPETGEIVNRNFYNSNILTFQSEDGTLSTETTLVDNGLEFIMDKVNYNIYGIDGHISNSNDKGPYNITVKLKGIPEEHYTYENIKKITWQVPKSGTMITNFNSFDLNDEWYNQKRIWQNAILRKNEILNQVIATVSYLNSQRDKFDNIQEQIYGKMSNLSSKFNIDINIDSFIPFLFRGDLFYSDWDKILYNWLINLNHIFTVGNTTLANINVLPLYIFNDKKGYSDISNENIIKKDENYYLFYPDEDKGDKQIPLILGNDEYYMELDNYILYLHTIMEEVLVYSISFTPTEKSKQIFPFSSYYNDLDSELQKIETEQPSLKSYIKGIKDELLQLEKTYDEIRDKVNYVIDGEPSILANSEIGIYNLYKKFVDEAIIKTIEDSENKMKEIDINSKISITATYNVKTSYFPGADNNTMSCEIIYGESERVYKGSVTLQFGEYSSAASDYSLNIDFINGDTCLYQDDVYAPDSSYWDEWCSKHLVGIKATLSDNTNGNNIEIQDQQITWSWLKYENPYFGGQPIYEQVISFYLKPFDSDKYEEQNTSNIDTYLSDTLYISLNENFWGTDKTPYGDENPITPSNYYAILQCQANIPLANKTKRIITAYLPIPFCYDNRYNDNYKQIIKLSGPTRIIYDSLDNIYYNKDRYQLWQFNGEERIIQGSALSINSFEEISSLGFIPSYKPTIKGINFEYFLQPAISMPDKMVGINISYRNGEWIQPILLLKHKYFNDYVNNWDGSVYVDQEKGFISSPTFLAGEKDKNGLLTGVMIGKVGYTKTNGNTENKPVGIYGFQNGNLRYVLDENGKFYVGNGVGSELNFSENKFSLRSGNNLILSNFSGTNNSDVEFGLGDYINKKNNYFYFNTNTGEKNGLRVDDIEIISDYFSLSSVNIMNEENSKKYGLFKLETFANQSLYLLQLSGEALHTPGIQTKSYGILFQTKQYSFHFPTLSTGVDTVEDHIALRGQYTTIDIKNNELNVQNQLVGYIYFHTINGTKEILMENDNFYGDIRKGRIYIKSGSEGLWMCSTHGEVDIWGPGKLNFRNSSSPTGIYIPKSNQINIKSNQYISIEAVNDADDTTYASLRLTRDITNNKYHQIYLTTSEIWLTGGGVYVDTTNGFSLRKNTTFNYYSSTDNLLFQIWEDAKNGGIVLENKHKSTAYLQGSWASENDLSDERIKNSIEQLPEQYEILFDNLKPVRYKYNYGTSNRYHTGYIAQEVVQAVETAKLTTQDFAAVMLVSNVNKNATNTDTLWHLRRDEFISLNTWQIQKLKSRVAELEKEIKELKNEI